MRRKLTFSSLFIGSGSVTRQFGQKPFNSFYFQFPLHREWFCYKEILLQALAQETAFSSLFIGSGSVTAPRADV